MALGICKSSWFFPRYLTVGAAVLAALLVFIFAGVHPFHSMRKMGFGCAYGATAPALDLAHPDVIIKTISLAKLPRDLLQVPIFRDVLTKDFVFYYEQNEGRLGLSGVLRRMAYEHHFDLGDWVIRTVIDEPAEIALWKGANGRLKHYLIAMSRNNLAKLVEMAAKIALSDKQLKRIEETLSVEGERVPIFALTYTDKRTLLFATHGERMVILSDDGMLRDGSGEIADGSRSILAGLLSRDAKSQGIYQDQFKLTGKDSDHTLAVTARYLSFGYQHFFPAFEALRFDFGKNGWSTHVMFNPDVLPAGGINTLSLWNTVPMEPSVCIALPIDWNAAVALLQKFGAKEQQVRGIVGALDGPVAVCWYPKSHLHTPVFVVPLKRQLNPSETELVAKTFEAVIGAKESSLPKDKSDARFPVTVSRRPDSSYIWQREVTSRYGVYRQVERVGGAAEDARFFRVTLVQHAKALIFSPDDRLVEDVLAVANKKFPALGDSLPKAGAIIAVITPASLSALLQAETFSSLPATEEPVFRSAANAHLLPKLAALKKYPAYSLVLPVNVQPLANLWLTVRWQTLGKS